MIPAACGRGPAVRHRLPLETQRRVGQPSTAWADVVKHPGGDDIALEHQITVIIGLEYAGCE